MVRRIFFSLLLLLTTISTSFGMEDPQGNELGALFTRPDLKYLKNETYGFAKTKIYPASKILVKYMSDKRKLVGKYEEYSLCCNKNKTVLVAYDSATQNLDVFMPKDLTILRASIKGAHCCGHSFSRDGKILYASTQRGVELYDAEKLLEGYVDPVGVLRYENSEEDDIEVTELDHCLLGKTIKATYIWQDRNKESMIWESEYIVNNITYDGTLCITRSKEGVITLRSLQSFDKLAEFAAELDLEDRNRAHAFSFTKESLQAKTKNGFCEYILDDLKSGKIEPRKIEKFTYDTIENQDRYRLKDGGILTMLILCEDNIEEEYLASLRESDSTFSKIVEEETEESAKQFPLCMNSEELRVASRMGSKLLLKEKAAFERIFNYCAKNNTTIDQIELKKIEEIIDAPKLLEIWKPILKQFAK